MTTSILARISDKFLVGDECWEWTAARNRKGYGTLGNKDDLNRTILAHRIVYELMKGPVPEGLELDHLCRNRGCVRPDHLEPVTHAENMRRGIAGALQAAKTHCPQGHEYSPENTYRRPGPRTGRNCRTCVKEAMRRYRERQRG